MTNGQGSGLTAGTAMQSAKNFKNKTKIENAVDVMITT